MACPGSIYRSSLIAFSFLLAVLISSPAFSQTLQTLYTFQYPLQDPDGLVPNGHGEFYGEVFDGFAGQIYKIDRSGQKTTIFSFNSTDGDEPNPQLVFDSAGNLYGTTSIGGAYGHGNVFKIDTAGNETVLHDFQGVSVGDGDTPRSGPIIDKEGNLYGTTQVGGVTCVYQGHFTKTGCGTVYKVTPAGVETILHRFRGSEGQFAYGPLVRDLSGNFYGTASNGGLYGNGTIFKIGRNGVVSVFYDLQPTDGASPLGGLVFDASGNLYGTTYLSSAGCGSVFRLSPAGQETLRYFFNFDDGCEYITVGALTVDSSGNIYGATTDGGTYGAGVIFKIDPSGNETVLYTFTDGPDGGSPDSTLLWDSKGNLYGTTFFGGSREGQCAQFGCGVIFEFTP